MQNMFSMFSSSAHYSPCDATWGSRHCIHSSFHCDVQAVAVKRRYNRRSVIVSQRSETERLVAAFERSEVAAADADTLARLTMRAALHSIDRCASRCCGCPSIGRGMTNLQ